MDQTWLSVADVAAELGVSPQRVRALLQAGALDGRKLGGVWFVDPAAAQRRSGRGSRAGRPLSAENAWRMLSLLAEPETGNDLLDPLLTANAVDRSRLLALTATVPDSWVLARRLSARARVRRLRAHTGVLPRLLADTAVSVGGSRAAAEQGGGISAGGVERIYLSSADVDAVVQRYRLRPDVEGNVELAVLPDGVDDALLPRPGRPVPVPVAWTDLLDSPDTRARHAAHEWAKQRLRTLPATVGRRR